MVSQIIWNCEKIYSFTFFLNVWNLSPSETCIPYIQINYRFWNKRNNLGHYISNYCFTLFHSMFQYKIVWNYSDWIATEMHIPVILLTTKIIYLSSSILSCSSLWELSSSKLKNTWIMWQTIFLILYYFMVPIFFLHMSLHIVL